VSPGWDAAAWAALADELAAWAAAGRPAGLWWRDDDAGEGSPALDRLLALAAGAGVPLALAVVPAWLTPEAAAAVAAAPPAVVVLQHGFAHANHERDPMPGTRKVKPAECGAARPAPAALAELAEGRRRLGALGGRVRPVLVPPWNRIAPAVAAGLPGLGYRGLSTFGPRAAPEAAPGLRQVNCHLDPIVWREGRRFLGAGPSLERLRGHLAARRTGQADPAEPTGLLTHHRDLPPEGWAFLAGLLDRLRAHPAVAFPSLPALLEAPG
jgi:hypothetical protein